MGREKSGGWKLRNVIIEDVNLGEIYRDQFLTSAREQDGNLEAVIDTWTSWLSKSTNNTAGGRGRYPSVFLLKCSFFVPSGKMNEWPCQSVGSISHLRRNLQGVSDGH